MDRYYIDEHVPIKAYRQWGREKGEYEIVRPIKFIGYTERAPKGYEGQIWRCKTEDNQRVIKKIRVKIHELDLKKTKQLYNANKKGGITLEDLSNPYIDEYDDFVKGRITTENKWLKRKVENEKSFHNYIKKVLRPQFPILTVLFINFKINPNRKTLAAYHRYKNTDDFNKFITQLKICRNRHTFMIGKSIQT